MTMQMPEKIRVRGNFHTTYATPLSGWLSLMEAEGRPAGFRVSCSACWRGYVGTWEVRDDALWVMDIHATGPDGREISAQDIFPGRDFPVLADWFSGEIRLSESGERFFFSAGQLIDNISS